MLVDPRRPGHGLSYYPGEANLRMADIVLVHKMYGTTKEHIQQVEENTKSINKKAKIIEVRSLVIVKEPEAIKGKRALVIGDGPTLTHGGMAYGIGTAAAIEYKAKTMVDPRKYAVGSIKEVYKKFPHLERVIPAMGYSKQQLKDLEASINRTPSDIVIDGTPSDLQRLIKIKKKVIYASYDIENKDLQPVYNRINQIVR